MTQQYSSASTHQPLAHAREDVKGNQSESDVFPVALHANTRLSVAPGQEVVVAAIVYRIGGRRR